MRLFAFAVLSLMPLPLIGQASLTSVSAQQPTWVGSPDWSAITVHMTTPAGQMGPILHRPFSAIEVRHSQQVLADGTHVDHTDTSNFYRDAEGRMRVQGTRVVVLFDPTIDATYTLHLQERVYDQYSAGGRGKSSTTIAAYGNSNHIDTPGVAGPVETVTWGQIPHGSEPVTHVETEQLGGRSIDGLLCKGTRVTVTIPAHAVGNDRELHVVNERWYSDDLMALVRSSNEDPRFGTTTYELTEVKRGDPEPSLFRLPEGFTKSARH